MRILLLLAVLAGAAILGVAHLPPAWSPFAPLDLRETPNMLTGWKLARAQADPARCLAALATLGPVTTRPAVAARDGCGITTPVVPDGLAPAGAVADCPLALAIAGWRRHGAEPAARAILGGDLARLEHVGIYACRDVRGVTGRRSRHATARALDVRAFRLADGRRVPVTGWDGGGAAAHFLRAARDSACDWFGAVLGPEHDAAHRDHFHLESGFWRRCR